MTRTPTGPAIHVDLSNLCRDRRLLADGVDADLSLLDRLTEALERSSIEFGSVVAVADRSLPPLLVPAERRRFQSMVNDDVIELSSLADERLLERAFDGPQVQLALVASMDNFDDFRRSYPMIQGSTDRFLGWEPDNGDGLNVFRRDMGIHNHQRLSRKEESADLKARRLQRRTVVDAAAGSYFRCENRACLIAQLWPDRLRELPRYDDRADRFVCPSCRQALTAMGARPPSSQLIVYLGGAEQFRVLVEEGDEIAIGRKDGPGCIGLASRLPAAAADAVSRRHLGLRLHNGSIHVEDLGSRNGSVLRSGDAGLAEVLLPADERRRLRRGDTLILPGDITIELSGRSIAFDGEQPEGGSDDDDRGRATLLL